jgi:hypothetical protein
VVITALQLYDQITTTDSLPAFEVSLLCAIRQMRLRYCT